MDSTQTEEDLKRLLKQLVLEKKKVRELEKKLGGSEPGQKFQSKLLQKHQATVSEESLLLRQHLTEKEQQLQNINQQLNKTKLALKQVFDQLQEAKEKIKTYENLPPQVSLQELEQKEKMYASSVQKLEQEKRTAVEELKLLQQDLERHKESEQREIQRFENERSRLVEKLAESLSQHQRQQETVKDLHEEINRLRQSNTELKHHLEDAQNNLERLIEQKQQDTEQIRSLKKQETDWLHNEENMRMRLVLLEERLSESDVAAVHEEYADKLRLQKEQMDALFKNIETEKELLLKQLEEQDRAKEKVLENSYEQIRELSRKGALATQEYTKIETSYKELQEQFVVIQREYALVQAALRQAEQVQEEKLQEVRQAQHHLAKKVKETTLLRDLTEEQKQKSFN